MTSQATGENLGRTPGFVDGDVSFWYRDIGVPQRRPALPGNIDVDVAIVGGGLTGLWTAYYLKSAQPDLRIAVIEKEFAGFGASGRNGGWLSAESPGQLTRYAATHGHDAAVRMQRTMFDAVDEVIRVATKEGIEAHIQKSGLLHVATNRAQHARLLHKLPELRHFGWGSDDLKMLDADELRARVSILGGIGASWSPHCARIQPALLVRGLADAVERMGVRIYEGTAVRDIRPGAALTDLGTVTAPYVIRALEGFTANLTRMRRTWLPMSSSMIVTEPLSSQTWERIGWSGAELVGDEAHGFAYAQRTEDGRIALGGRAVPYRYGSRTDRRGETLGNTIEQLQAVMGRLFPAANSAGIDHAWAGVLGVPRDWCATVGLDEGTGLGWAGGYVGHGVTSTNVAGQTLADLVLKRQTDLVTLSWVGRRVRKWEPEPIRWIAVRSLYHTYHAADRHERASGSARTSSIARVADKITGR
ncbi:FAD-dependent oxidoreductase [Aeromicrobium sp.]|uniref:NAD(P)/FAD-dependent oxidoreductase n=1 Tax=Aeromicrobium sp. TaxID=1871063 RepID=UPI0030C31FF5